MAGKSIKILIAVLGAICIACGAAALIYGAIANRANAQYCFAFWAPHGGYWQDSCYDDRKECADDLAERMEMGSRLNTKSCYRLKMTRAYCIEAVLTGKMRSYDFEDGEYEETTRVCTITREECLKFVQYSLTDADEPCQPETVSTREAEGFYLSTKAELDGIIKNNAGRALPVKKR